MLKHDFGFDDSPLGAAYFDLVPAQTIWDMGGGDLSGAYKDAAQIQANAAEKAANTQFTMFQMAQNLVAPWREAGGTANAQIAGLLGLPGYTALDPTSTLQATPGYNWMMGQGVNALDRSAAARGMNMSGPQMKALTDYGQNLGLTKAWNPYMANLQSLSGQGMGTAGQTGQWGMQTGQGMGQDYMAGAQAQAQGLINSAIAQQQQSGGLMSDIMGGLGLVGGLAMAPFTGGTSLFGSGLSGLSGMFGGGGGGGGGSSLVGISNALGGGGWGSFPMYAEGGAIPSGQPAIVGERGPEVFVPDQPGYIVPNRALSDIRYRYKYPEDEPVAPITIPYSPALRYTPPMGVSVGWR